MISDNNDDLNTISIFLEDLVPDCLVIPAQSGIVGIESTKAESPEMVLLDLEIGGDRPVRGVQNTEIWRKHKTHPDSFDDRYPIRSQKLC